MGQCFSDDTYERRQTKITTAKRVAKVTVVPGPLPGRGTSASATLKGGGALAVNIRDLPRQRDDGLARPQLLATTGGKQAASAAPLDTGASAPSPRGQATPMKRSAEDTAEALTQAIAPTSAAQFSPAGAHDHRNYGSDSSTTSSDMYQSCPPTSPVGGALRQTHSLERDAPAVTAPERQAWRDGPTMGWGERTDAGGGGRRAASIEVGATATLRREPEDPPRKGREVAPQKRPPNGDGERPGLREEELQVMRSSWYDHHQPEGEGEMVDRDAEPLQLHDGAARGAPPVQPDQDTVGELSESAQTQARRKTDLKQQTSVRERGSIRRRTSAAAAAAAAAAAVASAADMSDLERAGSCSSDSSSRWACRLAAVEGPGAAAMDASDAGQAPGPPRWTRTGSAQRNSTYFQAPPELIPQPHPSEVLGGSGSQRSSAPVHLQRDSRQLLRRATANRVRAAASAAGCMSPRALAQADSQNTGVSPWDSDSTPTAALAEDDSLATAGLQGEEQQLSRGAAPGGVSVARPPPQPGAEGNGLVDFEVEGRPGPGLGSSANMGTGRGTAVNAGGDESGVEASAPEGDRSDGAARRPEGSRSRAARMLLRLRSEAAARHAAAVPAREVIRLEYDPRQQPAHRLRAAEQPAGRSRLLAAESDIGAAYNTHSGDSALMSSPDVSSSLPLPLPLQHPHPHLIQPAEVFNPALGPAPIPSGAVAQGPPGLMPSAAARMSALRRTKTVSDHGAQLHGPGGAGFEGGYGRQPMDLLGPRSVTPSDFHAQRSPAQPHPAQAPPPRITHAVSLGRNPALGLYDHDPRLESLQEEPRWSPSRVGGAARSEYSRVGGHGTHDGSFPPTERPEPLTSRHQQRASISGQSPAGVGDSGGEEGRERSLWMYAGAARNAAQKAGSSSKSLRPWDQGTTAPPERLMPVTPPPPPLSQQQQQQQMSVQSQSQLQSLPLPPPLAYGDPSREIEPIGGDADWSPGSQMRELRPGAGHPPPISEEPVSAASQFQYPHHRLSRQHYQRQHAAAYGNGAATIGGGMPYDYPQAAAAGATMNSTGGHLHVYGPTAGSQAGGSASSQPRVRQMRMSEPTPRGDAYSGHPPRDYPPPTGPPLQLEVPTPPGALPYDSDDGTGTGTHTHTGTGCTEGAGTPVSFITAADMNAAFDDQLGSPYGAAEGGDAGYGSYHYPGQSPRLQPEEAGRPGYPGRQRTPQQQLSQQQQHHHQQFYQPPPTGYQGQRPPSRPSYQSAYYY